MKTLINGTTRELIIEIGKNDTCPFQTQCQGYVVCDINIKGFKEVGKGLENPDGYCHETFDFGISANCPFFYLEEATVKMKMARLY